MSPDPSLAGASIVPGALGNDVVATAIVGAHVPATTLHAAALARESDQEGARAALPVHDSSTAHAERVQLMRDVLLALPEPDPELKSAVDSGVHGEQLQELLEVVWKRRQVMLAEVAASMKSEAQIMRSRVDALVLPVTHAPGERPEADTVATVASEDDEVQTRLSALEDLEFFVSSVHNAEDFTNTGGMATVVALLNSSSIQTATHAAWVVGTACKYAPKIQAAALNMSALERLVQLSARVSGAVAHSVHESGADVSSRLREAGHVVYALGGLLRGGARTSAAHWVAASGHDALDALAAAAVRVLDAPAPVACAAAGRVSALLQKVYTLAQDVLLELSVDSVASAQQAAAPTRDAGGPQITSLLDAAPQTVPAVPAAEGQPARDHRHADTDLPAVGGRPLRTPGRCAGGFCQRAVGHRRRGHRQPAAAAGPQGTAGELHPARRRRHRRQEPLHRWPLPARSRADQDAGPGRL
ncbi:MAG: hypothetical protein EOO41_02835 [Methanobacteriota archaeon]|nr:MAG: hypothetical protein EOO41_02835 [Euryarchaeota archaeon]